jgi:hypothetical protein
LEDYNIKPEIEKIRRFANKYCHSTKLLAAIDLEPIEATLNKLQMHTFINMRSNNSTEIVADKIDIE